MKHISEIINEILVEWAYRVHDGMPNPKNTLHIQELRESMEELDIPSNVIYEVIENLINEEEDGLSDEEKEKAEKMGLVHLGRGAYGKEGDKATHQAIDGKLVAKDGGEEPEAETKPPMKIDKNPMDKKDDKDEKPTKPTIDIKRVNNVSREVYGESGTEGLLQASETTLQALQKGYKKGADYVAPGNAGSCFNENMSNEGVHILDENPDLSEDELTQIIFDRTKDETLGTQIKTTSIKSPHNKDKGTIPDELKGKENKQKRDLYNASRIAARSAIAKVKRIRKGESEAQNQVGFGKKTKIDSFGGTKNDLDKIKEKINSAKKVYVYDKETGKVYEIPKDVMVDWVDDSGGGENPGDTAVISMDENGNLLYDGWSDKINYNALQGNSTLNDDYTKQEKNINKLVEDGRLDKETAQTAVTIIKEAKQKSAEIEKNYKKAPLKEAEFFSTYVGDDRDRLLEHIKKQNEDYMESGTENHIQNAMKHYGVSTEEELLDALIDEAKNGKPAGNRLKVIGRIANLERKHLKEKTGQIPSQLNTRQILSDAREQALDVQKDTMTRLNQLKGKTSSGKEKRLGDIIGFQETIDFLHLDKIEEPSGDDDYNAILKRNTHLVMEGTDVPPQTVKKCLGVNNLQDAEDNFEVVQDEEIMKDQETGQFTTGKVVYIYAIKKGERTFIGKKTYRSKDGPEGKTSNTIEWSPDMQECFDRNREK
jgi:hypothetical protein